MWLAWAGQYWPWAACQGNLGSSVQVGLGLCVRGVVARPVWCCCRVPESQTRTSLLHAVAIVAVNDERIQALHVIFKY